MVRHLDGVAPGARPVEAVHADLVELPHLVHPRRMHPIGVIVRGVADLRQPQLAVEHVAGDLLGLLPHVGLVDLVGDAVAGEGELAGELAVRVLVDHAADVVRIEAGEHPVHHHLGDRDLAALHLAAGFEIDRLGEALLGLGALLGVEAEPLGRRLRPLAGAGDLALGGDGLAGARRAASGAGAADVVSKLKSSANGDTSAERLISGSWAGGASISTSSSAGQGWMVPTPSPMRVAEIEPPEPHRRVALALAVGERRLGGDSGLQRCDSVGRRLLGNRRLRWGWRRRHPASAGLGNETVLTRPGVRSRVPAGGVSSSRGRVTRRSPLSLRLTAGKSSRGRLQRRWPDGSRAQRAGRFGIVGADAGELIRRRLGNHACRPAAES